MPINQRFVAAALLCMAMAGPTVVHAKGSARSDALEMDDKDRATLSKETLKQSRMGQGKQKGLNTPNAQQGCGNVDIGNSEEKKGSNRIAERNRTVIVTGNVYNTAQCR